MAEGFIEHLNDTPVPPCDTCTCSNQCSAEELTCQTFRDYCTEIENKSAPWDWRRLPDKTWERSFRDV